MELDSIATAGLASSLMTSDQEPLTVKINDDESFLHIAQSHDVKGFRARARACGSDLARMNVREEKRDRL
jgi:hypothetical protein